MKAVSPSYNRWPAMLLQTITKPVNSYWFVGEGVGVNVHELVLLQAVALWLPMWQRTDFLKGTYQA